MPETLLGQTISGWTPSAKQDFKIDAEKLPRVPLDILRTVADKIARTFPACSPTELVAVEAEQRAFPDKDLLHDAISTFVYLWDNIGTESSKAVVADLVSLGLVSQDTAGILTDLLVSAEPFRETALVASRYIRIGAPVFVGIRGTVDIRLRFHKTQEEFSAANTPKALFGAQQVILANLRLNDLSGNDETVSFLMDENDLMYLKRFVRNMEMELELSKTLLNSSETTANG
jgi:hypothetical protein